MRRLAPKLAGPAGPLQSGSRVHEALEAYYTPDSPTDYRQALLDAQQAAWYAYLQSLEENEQEPDATVTDQFGKDCELERAMIEGYFEWLAETGADAHLTVIAAERQMSVTDAQLDIALSRPFTVVGKLDAVAIDDVNGRVRFIDHKTVRSFGDILPGLQQDSQMLHYMMLLNYSVLDYRYGQQAAETQIDPGSMGCTCDISGTQSSASVDVLFLRGTDNGGDRKAELDHPSHRRGSREQRSEQSSSVPLGMPQLASQQGAKTSSSDRGTPTQNQRGIKTTRSGDQEAHRGNQAQDQRCLACKIREATGGDEARIDGAIYNMLRKVKRTKAAKPPFYMREWIDHNASEIESYRLRLAGLVANVFELEDRIARLGDEGAAMYAYPNPTRDCSWDCSYYDICSMFDDGSRVEDAIRDLFAVRDPMARYDAAPGTIE